MAKLRPVVGEVLLVECGPEKRAGRTEKKGNLVRPH